MRPDWPSAESASGAGMVPRMVISSRSTVMSAEVVAHAAHLLTSVGVQVILATHSQLLYDALLRAERRPQGQPMRLFMLEPRDEGERHVVVALNPPEEEDANDDSEDSPERDFTPPPFAVEPRQAHHRRTAAKNVRPDRRRTRLPSPGGAEAAELPAVAVDDRPIIDRGPIAKIPRVPRPRRGRPPRSEVEAAMEAARLAEEAATAEADPPEEPPGLRVTSHGFELCWVTTPSANSWVCALPMMMAPASGSLATCPL